MVEFESIGPGPEGAMLLADLGAGVLRIARPAVDRGALMEDRGGAVMHRGRRAITLDLKAPDDLDLARRLIGRADGLIEGLRPGVMEKLGLGPDAALALNPGLVYGRITGWGQEGPLARSAGHDINYIALSGVLGTRGPADGPPLPPLNLVGDVGGGGLFLAFGMLAALIEAGRTGKGQVVDAAMLDGAASQMALIYAWRASGVWSDVRGANLLGGFDRTLYDVGADTGDELWPYKADDLFWGKPLVLDGTVYAPNLDGRLYALNLEDGTPVWDAPFEALEPLRSAPLLAGDALVLVDRKGNVYGLDPETGNRIWSRTEEDGIEKTVLSNPIADSPVLVEEVFISAQGGDLFRIDPETGSFVKVVTP